MYFSIYTPAAPIQMIHLPPGQFGQLTPREKGSEESKKIQAFRECFEGLPVGAMTYGTAGNPHLWDDPKFPFTPTLFKQMAGVWVAIYDCGVNLPALCDCGVKPLTHYAS